MADRSAVMLRTLAKRPDLRRLHAERCLANATDPAVRAKLVAAKRANWADPEYRARQTAAIRRGKASSFHRIVDLR